MDEAALESETHLSYKQDFINLKALLLRQNNIYLTNLDLCLVREKQLTKIFSDEDTCAIYDSIVMVLNNDDINVSFGGIISSMHCEFCDNEYYDEKIYMRMKLLYVGRRTLNDPLKFGIARLHENDIPYHYYPANLQLEDFAKYWKFICTECIHIGGQEIIKLIKKIFFQRLLIPIAQELPNICREFHKDLFSIIVDYLNDVEINLC